MLYTVDILSSVIEGLIIKAYMKSKHTDPVDSKAFRGFIIGLFSLKEVKERVRNLLQIEVTLQSLKGGDALKVLKRLYDDEVRLLMEFCKSVDTSEVSEKRDELQDFFYAKLYKEQATRGATADYIYLSMMYHAVHNAWDTIFDFYERDREQADSLEETDKIYKKYSVIITPLNSLKDALKELMEESRCNLIEF